MSLLSKATSLIRGDGPEKDLKTQEKRYQKQLKDEKKEKKLESRRNIILQSAADVLPSDENRGKFQSEDYTAETPFKASERHNPLFERRDAEKTEEERKINKVSKVFNVNLSEAKVMLARNPDILKQQKRPQNSRSESSAGSYTSSMNSPSMNSPSMNSPSMNSPRIRSPLTAQRSRDGYFPQSPHDSSYSESIYTPRIVQHARNGLASPVINNEAELYEMAQRSR